MNATTLKRNNGQAAPAMAKGPSFYERLVMGTLRKVPLGGLRMTLPDASI